MDNKIAELEKAKEGKQEQLVSATAGKLVRVKNGQPAVVTAEDVEEY